VARDLRDFLELIRGLGPVYYAEASRPLNPVFEISALQHQLAEAGRFPALYCSEIAGSELPLVAGLLGSRELLGLALGVTPAELSRGGTHKAIDRFRKALSRGVPVNHVSPDTAPVREVVRQGIEVDLARLPIVHHAEGDSGRYITAGMAVMRHSDGRAINFGIYRHEVKGCNRLGCRFNPTSYATNLARRYAELGRPMEIVIAIGHHPAVAVAAAYRGAPDFNEMELAGALLGEPLEVVTGLTVDLPVPARAEIAIEGVIDLTETGRDGPLCEGLGYYGGQQGGYLIRVNAITQRRDAIYQDIYPAHPEHVVTGILGRIIEVEESVRREVPELAGFNYGPQRQLGQVLGYVQLRDGATAGAMKACRAALDADPYLKIAIALDADLDIYNDQDVLYALSTRITRESDVVLLPPATSGRRKQWRVMIDATAPRDGTLPAQVTPSLELRRRVTLENSLR